MIMRVFRVQIDPALREEFERKFATVSVEAVESKDGFIAASIGKPTRWAPDEYVMISQWRDEAALRAFAGDNWNEAVIPPGMEHFAVACWVHHYASFADN